MVGKIKSTGVYSPSVYLMLFIHLGITCTFISFLGHCPKLLFEAWIVIMFVAHIALSFLESKFENLTKRKFKKASLMYKIISYIFLMAFIFTVGFWVYQIIWVY